MKMGFRLGLAQLCFPLVVAGCGADVCTEIGCENTVEVGYTGRINVRYELFIQADAGMVVVHCNVGGFPEDPPSEPNPPEIECHDFGFRITGGEFSRAGELLVTIYDVENDLYLVEHQRVTLNKEELHHPNGPDCPPTCVDWSGAVVL